MKQMKTKFCKIHPVVTILLAFILLASFHSCKEEEIISQGLDAQQLVAGRIDGTWANPSKIIVPDNLPHEIFGKMRLVFTTDHDGYPAQFYAENCPIVFSSTLSNWTLQNQDSVSVVTLDKVSPVDSLKVNVSSSYLTISFFMGWENTDTKATGQGRFSVTLSRQ